MDQPKTHATFADRFLWTLTLGALTGAAGLLAARIAAWGWHVVRGEPPPKPIGLIHNFAKTSGVSALVDLLGR
jgi:hypothetical protein